MTELNFPKQPVWCCVWWLPQHWQHSSVVAAAEQCLHSIKALLTLSPSQQEGQGLPRRWMGYSLDLSCPGIFIPYSIILNSNAWGFIVLEVHLPRQLFSKSGWALPCSWDLFCTAFFFPLYPSLIKQPLSQSMSFLAFPVLIPSPWRAESGRNREASSCVWPRSTNHTWHHQGPFQPYFQLIAIITSTFMGLIALFFMCVKTNKNIEEKTAK